MNQLTQLKCTACRKGEPTVTEEEIAEFRPQVPDWSIIEVEGVKHLERALYAHAATLDAESGSSR